MVDLIIKNGMAIDTSLGINRKMNIAVNRGKIVETGACEDLEAKTVIDAEGCYVTPGLIDFHCHIYYGGCTFGLPPEIMHFPQGVTTVVDGGSTGEATFGAFYKNVLTDSLADTKAFLLMSSGGQISHNYLEHMNPDGFQRERILDVCEKYRDKIVGLKLRQSIPIVKEYGLEPLKRAVEIAEEAGLRVSVHSSNAPGEVKETLEILRSGDIYCHAFHQIGKTILDDNGKVLPEVWDAREKGVLFETARGNTQFSAYIAEKAFDQGFFPDIISSDEAIASKTNQPSMSFSSIMSELLNMGMPFYEIIKRCTEIPGRLIGASANGFLRKGGKADLAIFRIVDMERSYKDFYGNEVHSKRFIKPELTLKDGLIVHRAFDF